jgi:hypothetical protein
MQAMTCEHLRQLEKALQENGFSETYRGQAWSENCREWVYFDVVFDIERTRQEFALSPCVRVHENLDERSGTERGFFCETCQDGIMGRLAGARRFP